LVAFDATANPIIRNTPHGADKNSFSALTAFLGRQEGHVTHKTLCHLSQRFSSGKREGRKLRVDQLTQVHLENSH